MYQYQVIATFLGNLLVDSMSWYEFLSFPPYQLFSTYMNSRYQVLIISAVYVFGTDKLRFKHKEVSGSLGCLMSTFWLMSSIEYIPSKNLLGKITSWGYVTYRQVI